MEDSTLNPDKISNGSVPWTKNIIGTKEKEKKIALHGVSDSPEAQKDHGYHRHNSKVNVFSEPATRGMRRGAPGSI